MDPMQSMAVDCSWADAQLESDAPLVSSLPIELLSLIRSTAGSQYLDAIASATLYPAATDRLSAYYRQLLPEITARWLLKVDVSPFAYHVLVLSGLAKVIPFAPYLKPSVKDLMSRSQSLASFANANTALSGLDDEQLHNILLAFFRLFTYDLSFFKPFVHPTLLCLLCKHDSPALRYLAVQCFSQVMGFADALTETLLTRHVGRQGIRGIWEGKVIDIRLMKLLEERRWKQQYALLSSLAQQSSKFSPTLRRTLKTEDLLLETANLGGILIPRFDTNSPTTSYLVQTPTTTRCIREIGLALLGTKSILLKGEPGSGKTSLVLEAARELNMSSLITLHLNEQTDAKSLLGLYTSSKENGSFIWQPGVLTQAIREGRWILIEDIDKAPADVLGVIRPIVQDGELYLPNRKETLRPAAGFRILATMRAVGKSSNSNVHRNSWILNDRYWSVIDIPKLDHIEICDLINNKFPSLSNLVSSIMEVHQRVEIEYRINHALRSTTARSPSLRDLLKWCRRTLTRLGTSEATSGRSISEATKLDIFRDAVDCYAGHLAAENAWSLVAGCVAEVMHIAPQQAQYCIKADLPKLSDTKDSIQIGRATLQKSRSTRGKSQRLGPFAFTRQASMIMGKIAAATSQSEPVLLVGETGVGKTTLIQHIANLLGQFLTVVNLSQQSEASDLLGGLKPVTTRSLMIPIVDKFKTLFDDTFSAKKNEKFLSSIQRYVGREAWQRVLVLWQQAVQMAETSLRVTPIEESGDSFTRTAKRRKLDTPKYRELRDRWTNFSQCLDQLRVQVDRAERHLTFAYVEGRIVQAVRHGGWLLLDEINLASSDTLDSIASLLNESDQERPHLHLTEAGDMERVVAHPDFRVFAAMNPATDTGKKDLAPGIRSRFTEIYVHAGDNDLHDLVNLIETYLSTLLDSDRRAAFDLANLYLEIKALNQEHRIVDGAGDDPHFTIRSLVRCLLYVQKHAAAYGLRRAIFEGANMSFCTMLSRESERMVLPLIDQRIFSGMKNVRAFLAQNPRTPSDGIDYVAFKHHLVIKGAEDIAPQPQYIRTPSVERNLLSLARAASMHRFPILLQGPTSSGKTSMVEYLAKSTGNQFIRVNNHEHTDLQEYLGSYATGNDGRLEFREGVLVQALRNGHWIVLDELNLAPSDVLEALNRLLDDNRELLIPETQEVVRPHPGFMLFATQNPAGFYGGRKRLSRAFRNRFLELHFDDIPEDELEVILQKRSQIAPSFCAQIVAVYKRLSLQRQSSRLFEQQNSFATLRDLFRWASRPMDDRTQLATQGFMLLGERVRDSGERQIVKDIIEEVIRVKVDLSALYSLDRIPDSLIDESVVWTPAMRRLFILVSTALKSNEPVLLVGETGCGKTQICQTVAQAFQNHLDVYNAHTNTETGDLIGSQRPARHKSEAHGELKRQLLALLDLSEGTKLEEESFEVLMHRFDQLDTSNVEEQALADARASIARQKALFEWVDGSLVRAMKDGHHFLLDEISLAEDSVLERLNSLLEPSRTILLAEKGPTDNSVVAAPGFQFLATMNPGGDYGKRELSAALRNRLTEVWVPPLAEACDVIPILESKLRPELRSHAKAMLEFSRWFRSTFLGSPTEAVPLRDLITWTDFLEQNGQLDANTALCHGAAMVFIDSIGANPAGIMSSATSNVKEARGLCIRRFSEITKTPWRSDYDEDLKIILTKEHFRAGCFQINRETDSTETTELVFDAPTTLRNTMRLVRALQMKRPVLLEGSPGVGKTAIVTALAKAVGKHLTRINLSDQTDLMDLFGADVPMENEDIGKFAWSDGPLLQAMQTGSWVLLDEMNLASQSVLEGLNSCLDHRKEIFIAELDRTFACHPDFRLFAAQNPHHQGGGRKGLPKSFVNRFTVVYADPFEKDDLYQICNAKFPNIGLTRTKAVVDVVSAIQNATESDPRFSVGGPWEFNLRDVSRWLQMLEQTPSLLPDHYFGALIAQRLRSSYQKDLAENLRGKVLGTNDRASLYHSLSPEVFQVGTSFLYRDKLWQKTNSNGQTIPTALLPYAQSVIEAINHKWPVIIADSEGSSSTTLINHLAAIAGATLTTVSLNAETDTMDLIGGLEQHDSYQDLIAVKVLLRRVVEEEILTYLEDSDFAQLAALLDLHFLCESPHTTVQDLRARLQGFLNMSDGFQRLLQNAEQLLDRQRNHQVGFVWNDGVLLNALQEGRWLVLENANTCNSAVLDRLNSLLEPNGVLIISEQRNPGGTSRIVQPHPNFRIFLTMDPQNGELSRAMRNRSMELFLDEYALQRIDSSFLGYPCAADLYRIRHVENLGVNDAAATMQALLTNTWIEHISEKDRNLLEDCLAQNSLSLSREAMLQRQLKASKWLPSAFKDKYSTLQLQLLAQAHLDEAKFLPFLPLPAINEPLIALSSDQSMEVRAQNHAWTLQNLLSIQDVLETVDQARETSQILHRKDKNLLEKSLAQGTGTRTKGGNLPFSEFLVLASMTLRDAIEHDLGYGFDTNSIRFMENVLAFLDDILNLSRQSSIRPGIFPAYLQNGYDLVNGGPTQLSALRFALLAALDLFAQKSKLKSGRSLHIMWEDLRPLTAATELQLHGLIRLEALLERVDNLSISVGSLSYITKAQQQLVEIYRSMLAGNTNDTTIFDHLDSQIVELEAIDGDDNKTDHFTGAFKAIHQLSLASKVAVQPYLVQYLANIPTSLDEVSSADRPMPQAFAAMLGMLNKTTSNTDWDAWRDKFGLALIQKIVTSEEQPISSVNWSRMEFKTLLQTLSSFGVAFNSNSLLHRLRHELHNIVISTFSCHGNLLSADDHACLARGDVTNMKLTFAETVTSDHYFRTIYQDYLFDSLQWLTQTSSSQAIQYTGAAFFATSLGLLRLLVPDQPYDPALTSQVALIRFRRRQRDIQNVLTAQKIFEARFTGQKSSLLIRMTEEKLTSIGNEPAIAAVFRPPINGIELLTVEFTNLLRSIVDSRPEKVLLADIPGRWQDKSVSGDDARKEGEKLLRTIDQILKRLGLVDRAFDDLKKPVVWILQSMMLGIRMLATASSNSTRALERIQCRASQIPLLSSSPDKIMGGRLLTISSHTWHTEDCFDWLEHVALSKSIEKDFKARQNRTNNLLEVTDSMYESWKVHLEKDQDAALARSKYYAYRGDEDLDESQEKQAVTQMFPTFDDEAHETGYESVAASTGYDAGAIAVRLAKFQRRYFSNNDNPAKLEAYIDVSMDRLSNAASQRDFELGPVPSQDLMPAILLKLDQRMSALDAAERKARFNIYTDGNIVEACKLHDLVKSVIKNFHGIHLAWPEHAVPVEVLGFSREILKFTFKDPIAKLLTKTEKLLDIVGQWQAIASKEYSATGNIDDLTKLIIRWRQLELSSWSRLLDLERQKVDDTAQSWYFMLYEAIISNPRQMSDQQAGLSAYLKELAQTLEDFLTSTSCGEFSSRLQLCQSFEQFLVSIVEEDEMLRPVLHCVQNMLRRHERYQQLAESTLAKGRTELEKKLQEQIKLASWKDTNVSALRESARRSHFKLFKVVRKYRALLSQPFQSQTASKQEGEQLTANLAFDLLASEVPTAALEPALTIAAETLSTWVTRPERLQNPVGAAARMKLLVRRQGDDFTASGELSHFLASLQSSMKDLRNRTPSTLTEDNQSLVNHLKGLKQTLFSDTLRALKQMGVKRDLGVTEMEKQMSSAVVLANTSSLASKYHPQIWTSADNEFHDMLDLMPAIRSALTDHSEQVRVADFRRSVAYADGLLSIMIQQRQAVAMCQRSLDLYGVLMKKLCTFAQWPSGQFEHASSDFQYRRTLLTGRLCWLPEILAISAKALRIQMKHSGAELDPLIDSLLAYSQAIKDHVSHFHGLAPLPAGIRLKQEVELTRSVADLLDHLQHEIETAIVKHPQSATILQKLLPWTAETTADAEPVTNGLHQPSIEELDHEMCECLNVTFEAVQQISSSSERMPKSMETAGWLAKSYKCHAEMMNMLQLANVTQRLGRVESIIAHVRPDELLGSISLIVTALPILEQYLLISQYVVGQALTLHRETARMAVVLGRTLTRIASEGFCSPSEDSKGEEQSGAVENGTGLGNGTGAEDISKDIGDDEDLSEIAQMESEKPEGQDLEASKDAVNMDKDDLKGDDGGAEESDGEEEDASSESGDEEGSDLDEETGSVDDLDSSAVDEKMWEGLDAEKDKELENEKAHGKKSDEQTAKQEKSVSGDDGQQQDEGADEDVEDSASASGSEDEGDGVGRDEVDQADPNLQEEKPLDLPEDMQLNGEEKDDQEGLSDDGMTELSDVEEDHGATDVKDADDNGEEERDVTNENEQDTKQDSDDEIDEAQKEEQTGQADDDEIMEDQSDADVTNEEHDHDARNDDMTYDIDDDQIGEMGDGGAMDAQENAAEVAREKSATSQNDQAQEQSQNEPDNEENDKGTDETGGVTRGGRSETELANPQAEALKKLGDILAQWHERREIHQATQDATEQTADDNDMADADFEHVQNEEDKGDAQALGAASKEQAQTLDPSKAIEDDEMHSDTDQTPADVDEKDRPVQENMAEHFSQLHTNSDTQQDSGPGAIMPERRRETDYAGEEADSDLSTDEHDLETVVNAQLVKEPYVLSSAEASKLWSHYSAKVQHISLILTEQLRLILAPTLATKLRGDFRTGKRLNIKRIIPYIASGYKRDKIWMRRSVPSKRNYQIMLALDDSKSMMEGGAGALALETLAMLCKSLSMLEVGDLCVVGFGNEEHIRVAHPFGQPFGNEAGVTIFQNFTFNQSATDVRKMVKESISLFQDARMKSTGSQSELWQLQLVISDGICEDHETISRLVREGKEAKIMIVFVIVDGSGESILDLKQASFEPDETGEMKLSMRRYLEKFPFPFYLVVRDVRDLPAVLATALKGWFAQVMDVQG